MSIILDFDNDAGVLYARLDGARVAHSQESEVDGSIIVNFSEMDRVVGVQIVDVSPTHAECLAQHFAGPEFPAPLFEALARWFRERMPPAPAAIEPAEPMMGQGHGAAE